MSQFTTSEELLLDDVRDTERGKLPLIIFTNRESECCPDNQKLRKSAVRTMFTFLIKHI